MKIAFWMSVCAAAMFFSGLASLWWATREGHSFDYAHGYLYGGVVLVVLSIGIGFIAAVGAVLLKATS